MASRWRNWAKCSLHFWWKKENSRPQIVAEAIWKDYQAGGRSDKPPFLRPYLPEAVVSRRDRSRSVAPKRQERHLAQRTS